MTNREEVAARLREHSTLYLDKDIYQAVFGRPPVEMMISERKRIADRLADLIDPTCRMRETVEDERTVYVCSNCGSWKSEDNKKILSLFNYCPVCGARVVRDEA